MFSESNLGQYIPGDSLLHKLDPRTKFLCLLVFLPAVIASRSPQAVGFMLLVIVILFLVSRIYIFDALATLKPLIPVLFIAFLFNIFVPGKNDALIFQWGIFSVSRESALNAIVMTVRIICLIFASNLLLSLTTTANELSTGITTMLLPLEKVGVPAQDLGMMLSIALRFVPILIQETDTLMKAQSSRGANYDTGGWRKKIQGLLTILVPLFIGAFRKSETLAEAMEARAYRSDIKRGRLYPLAFSKKDYVFMLVFAIIIVVIFMIK